MDNAACSTNKSYKSCLEGSIPQLTLKTCGNTPAMVVYTTRTRGPFKSFGRFAATSLVIVSISRSPAGCRVLRSGSTSGPLAFRHKLQSTTATVRIHHSCPRPIFRNSYPIRSGFKELVPNFAIRDAGSDEHRLPTSSTCINLLKVRRTPSHASQVHLTDRSGFVPYFSCRDTAASTFCAPKFCKPSTRTLGSIFRRCQFGVSCSAALLHRA
jgi:hypothetical protein